MDKNAIKIFIEVRIIEKGLSRESYQGASLSATTFFFFCNAYLFGHHGPLNAYLN
jgi:hypothetical protein